MLLFPSGDGITETQKQTFIKSIQKIRLPNVDSALPPPRDEAAGAKRDANLSHILWRVVTQRSAPKAIPL